jgi:hypothetical protein
LRADNPADSENGPKVPDVQLYPLARHGRTLTGVVMYRDLLTQALSNGGDEGRSDDRLLADLIDSRARLHATGAAAPVTVALARELSYDGALIRLCVALDVRATPVWFDSPGGERARLEGELARRGIRLPAPELLHA